MATFPTVIPDYTFKEETQYATLTSTMWGPEQRRNKWGPKKLFSLRFNHITTGDMRYIWDFFIARKGDYNSFTWVHPETSTSYTVRFAQPELKIDEVGPDAFNMECQLLEVF